MAEFNIYERCPIHRGALVYLALTNRGDAPDLLRCYSDKRLVPYFNSDNCGGDIFYYTTQAEMQRATENWEWCYRTGQYVRLTIRLNKTREVVGTVEMSRRKSEDGFDGYGILRIDLVSWCEESAFLADILRIVNDRFFEAFDVERILTKAIPRAEIRRKALLDDGWTEFGKFLQYDDYFIKDKPDGENGKEV